MNIELKENGESVIVKPKGNLTSKNCSAVKKKVAEILRDGAHVIFDLEDIKFVDSSGIGMLALVQRQVQNRGGQMAIVNLMDGVSLVFQVTRAFEIFDIYDCVTTAQLKVAV